MGTLAIFCFSVVPIVSFAIIVIFDQTSSFYAFMNSNTLLVFFEVETVLLICIPLAPS